MVLGSGLTMVDVALTATAAGATVEAISRHGWLPTAHPEPRATPRAPYPIPAASLTAEQVRQLVIDRALAEPAGWAAGMDAARDHANELWTLLPADEQAKVLRQMLTAWTVHRHRMSPPVAARLAALQAANRVRVHPGTVTAVRVVGDEVELSGNRGERWTGGLLVACTGPSADIGRTTDPLLRHLIATGLAVVGPHRLGLAVDPRGQLVGPDGSARPGLFALGLLRRGTVFETTAIPEIRAQALALASFLAAAVPPRFRAGDGASSDVPVCPSVVVVGQQAQFTLPGAVARSVQPPADDEGRQCAAHHDDDPDHRCGGNRVGLGVILGQRCSDHLPGVVQPDCQWLARFDRRRADDLFGAHLCSLVPLRAHISRIVETRTFEVRR